MRTGIGVQAGGLIAQIWDRIWDAATKGQIPRPEGLLIASLASSCSGQDGAFGSLAKHGRFSLQNKGQMESLQNRFDEVFADETAVIQSLIHGCCMADSQ